MPPKGSGRRGTRGRGGGRGRGGATSSVAQDAPAAETLQQTPAPTPQTSGKAAGSTPSEPVAISTLATTQGVSLPSDDHPTPETAAAAVIPAPDAATPSDAAKNTEPSRSRTSASTARGARARLRRPPNTVRRSKEERDAAEQAEAARRREKLAELQAKADAAEAAARRREFRGRGRGGGSSRGRGGFMSAESVSGPFSGGMVSTGEFA